MKGKLPFRQARTLLYFQVGGDKVFAGPVGWGIMRIEACGFATGEYFTLVFVFVSVSGVTLMHRKTFPFTMIFNLSPKEFSLKHAAFCSQGYIKWQNLSRVGK